MKKALFAIVIASLGLGYWLLSKQSAPVPDVESPASSEETSMPAHVNTTAPFQTTAKDGSTSLAERPVTAQAPRQVQDHEAGSNEPMDHVSDQEVEQIEQYFNRIEGQWFQGMQELITKEMGLDQKVFQEYQKLKQNYERDKFEAFEQYHNQMLAKHGENYPVDLAEQDHYQNKVRDQYNDHFRKLVGDDNFQKYQEFLSQFNQRNKDNSDMENGVMLIDY